MSSHRTNIALAVVTLLTIAGYLVYKNTKPRTFMDWPKDAQEFALNEMPRLMQSHDFDPEMNVWSRDKKSDPAYLYSRENDLCRKTYKASGWKISENSVSAFFRCDLGDRWADYAVTILRYPYRQSFQTSGQYTIFPKKMDKGPTENIVLTFLPSDI